MHDNSLPLYVGSDTTGRAAPEAFFVGRVDEVRVSRVGRYELDFRPKKRHEPDEDTVLLLHFDRGLDGVFLDSSGNHNHAWPVGNPRLEEK